MRHISIIGVNGATKAYFGGGRNITRGYYRDVQRFIDDFSAQAWPFPKYRGNEGVIQTGVRPIQLWEFSVPKEQMEICFDGKSIQLDDYRTLKVFGANIKGMETKKQDKGHLNELLKFAKSIKEGDGYPIPLWQLIQATEISFEVGKML